MDHGVLLLLLTTITIIKTCNAVCSPGTITERGVPDHEKLKIVHVHNYFRKQNALGTVNAQPKASNMLKLTWDESLAQKAQEIAETCEFRHVKVKDPRFLVGQNLYTYYTTAKTPGANWKRAVKSWYDENETYRFSRRNYNHYTQVIWATTHKVGCGYVKFNKMYGQQSLYVCHYGPAGNMQGEIPYAVGPGCENLCEISNNDKIEKSEEEVTPTRPTIPPKPKWESKSQIQFYIQTLLHLLIYWIAKLQAKLSAPKAQHDYYTQTQRNAFYEQSNQPYEVTVYGNGEDNMQDYNYDTDYLEPDYDQMANEKSFYVQPKNEDQQITMNTKNIAPSEHDMYNPVANQFTNHIINGNQQYYEQGYYDDANGQQNYGNAHNYNNNQERYYFPQTLTRQFTKTYGR